MENTNETIFADLSLLDGIAEIVRIAQEELPTVKLSFSSYFHGEILNLSHTKQKYINFFHPNGVLSSFL